MLNCRNLALVHSRHRTRDSKTDFLKKKDVKDSNKYIRLASESN